MHRLLLKASRYGPAARPDDDNKIGCHGNRGRMAMRPLDSAPPKTPCMILFGASISIRCEDMADGNLTGHQTTDVIYQSYMVLLLVSSRPIIIVLTVLLGSCLQSCCILIIKYCKNLAVADYFTYLKLTKNTNTYIFTPNCKQIHLHI